MDEQRTIPLVDWFNSLRLRIKLILGFILVSAIVSFLTARGIYINLQKQINSEFTNRAVSIVNTAALQQGGDEFESIRSEQVPAYNGFFERNLNILEGDPDILSIFTLRKEGQNIYYVVDVGKPGEVASAVYGTPYQDATPTLINNFDTLENGLAEPEIHTDQNGSYIYAYAPITTDNGERVGVIGVKLLAATFNELRRNIIEQSILVFLVALGIGAFVGLVTGNVITEPIVRLTKGALSFADGHMEEEIEVTTNDEIGDLAKTFNQMSSDLQGLITGLEERVADRTKELESRSKELETANKDVQRRAAQFEALAQVAQSIASIRDIHELLPRVAAVVSNSYGFYHVGLFLVDEESEYAVLTATNSPGGQKMLARHHRLKVGEQGIVGSVTASGNPRIALDVGKDAVFFNNPDLPETHSEMALPLVTSGRVIGALDVQSREKGAFTDEDVQTLSLLANQVSLAIENARLFDETRRTLDELQIVSHQSTREAWRKLPKQQKILGYRYDAAGPTPLREPVKLTGTGKAKSKAKGDETAPYVVPIELRGQVIGNLVIQSPKGSAWNTDEQDIIKAVAERVALSAENARLFEETNQRAERERLVSEITGKIRSHNNPQAMIETAIDELRNALGATRVEVIPQKTTDNNDKDVKE